MTRPAPAEIENAEQFVFMTMIDALAGYRLILSKDFELGFLAGLDLLIRIPIAYDSSAAAKTGEFASYFYGALRFVYPVTEVSLKWNLMENIGLLFTIRALWPIFHLWDGESLPIYDQLILHGTLGFCIKL